jgi:RNA polymerase sigma-70 factor (ECF subfamily)
MNKRKSFPAYYSTFFEKIYRYIFFRVGREKELAEDMTSDIFLKAYESFENFDHDKSFSVWIYKIAHNHLVDHYRKARKEIVPLEDAENELKTDENPVSYIDLKFDLEQISLALQSMQEKQKEMIILKYFNDLQNKEIAEILGIKEEHARVLQHRAISALKSKITNLKRHE